MILKDGLRNRVEDANLYGPSWHAKFSHIFTVVEPKSQRPPPLHSMTRMVMANQKLLLNKVELTSRSRKRIEKATFLITNTSNINILIFMLGIRHHVKATSRILQDTIAHVGYGISTYYYCSDFLFLCTNKQRFNERLQKIVVQGNAITVANQLETLINALLREYDILKISLLKNS